MGFACYVCRGPFEECGLGPAHEKGGGDGHSGMPARSVSAILKCGHLFHTDCLKKELEAQSGNAWVPKSCPVCRETLTLQDLIRVHASSDDSRSQRPRLEELLTAQRKLRDEYERVVKLYKQGRADLEEMQMEKKAIMRSKEELTLRFDHLGRLNSVARADIDRYKQEIEKLKNIIITLTEKLTGNDCIIHEYYGAPMSNGLNSGNSFRLEFTEELQRYALCDPPVTQNLMNGSLPKPTLHHPPGFACAVQMGTENGSECPDSESRNTILPNGSNISKAFENADGQMSMSGSGNFMSTDNHHQGRMSCFTIEDVQVRDYDSNNNSAEMMQKRELSFSSDLVSKENAPIAAASDKSASFAAKTSLDKKERTMSLSKIAKSNKLEKMGESAYIEDDEVFDKWQEKKSRRRASSKSSGSGVRERGRYDSLADKKLLYGSFSCPTCKAKWGSSQSVLNTPQICRYCKTEVHPFSQGPILSRKQLDMHKQVPNIAAADNIKKKMKRRKEQIVKHSTLDQ